MRSDAERINPASPIMDAPATGQQEVAFCARLRAIFRADHGDAGEAAPRRRHVERHLDRLAVGHRDLIDQIGDLAARLDCSLWCRPQQPDQQHHVGGEAQRAEPHHADRVALWSRPCRDAG
jgi:hypothetical protein